MIYSLPHVLRRIELVYLCAFLTFNTIYTQEIDSSIIISDFQYPEIQGIPIILDESGLNTIYLNERNPENINDIYLNQVIINGDFGIPLGSYFLPKILSKSALADSVKNISQIYYRKGDYNYSDLGIGLRIESADSGLFSFNGFKGIPPQLYQTSEDAIQNYLFSFERKLDKSSIGVSTLYHTENINIPVDEPNINRKTESFHGGIAYEYIDNRFTLNTEQAFQFTYSNRWGNKNTYLTVWNKIHSSYNIWRDYNLHLYYHDKINFTEIDNEVNTLPSPINSSTIEYKKDNYSLEAGISNYESSLIPIGSIKGNWNSFYFIAKSDYEVGFSAMNNYHLSVIGFQKDVLIVGNRKNKYLGEVELFQIRQESRANLGMRGNVEINLPWLDLRHITSLYNLESDNSHVLPINISSYTSFIFSPNIWRWKQARYQPFIGFESTYIQHSGKMGIDLMQPAIFTQDTNDPFSSSLVNMEYGILVNQFKISYRWVKFNMLENLVNNSSNPNAYPILPIRHLEIIWQFWN